MPSKTNVVVVACLVFLAVGEAFEGSVEGLIVLALLASALWMKVGEG